MAKLGAAAAKLKTKALKSVTRNKTINSQLPNISDDWLAKPIVGPRIRATTGGNGGPQLTSPFKREQDGMWERSYCHADRFLTVGVTSVPS